MTTTTPDTTPAMRDLTRQNPKHAEAASEDSLLLTLDEAARELRCARRTLERYVADQQLTVVHLGRSVRVERRELERFIGRHREPTARG